MLTKVLGAKANPGSGIDELFPPSPAGRRRKQRLEIKNDNEALVSITQILFQVKDWKTNHPYVLITRPGEEPPCWVKIDQLSPATIDWWSKEKELRFPFIDFQLDAPSLRLSGGPVTVIFDSS